LAVSADPGSTGAPAAQAQPPLAAGRRRLLVGAAAAAALLALAMALAIALFDINRYKPEIEAAVRTHSGRTLHLNGDLALSFFPRLAVDLPASSLSARDNEAEFLSFSSARMEVALLPLLWQEVVIESLQLREARATMTLPDKHSSAAEMDEVSSGASGSSGSSVASADAAVPATTAAANRETRWEIEQLLLSDAALTVHNAVNGKTIVLSAIHLETGRLAAKTQLPLGLKAQVALMSQPEVLGEIEVTARVDIDMSAARPALAASDFKLGFTGRRDGHDRQPWRAALSARHLSHQGETFSAAQVEVSVQTDGEPATDAWTFAASAEEIAFDGQLLSLPRFDAEIAREDPRLPGGQARLPLSGALTLDTRHERASLQLAAQGSDARFEASIELTNFAQPEVGFDLQADRLNLDAYLPLAQPVAGKAAAGAKPAAAAPAAGSEPGQARPGRAALPILRTAAAAPTPRPAPASAPASAAAEPAFDLAGLHTLRLDGQLQIAQLQAGGIEATAVHARVHSADGRATLAPLSARLYGGQADGELTLAAQNTHGATGQGQGQGQGPQLSMKLALNDVDFGALARAALGRSDLAGRGNVDLALSSSGQSRAELTRAAQGTAGFALREVALVGIDLADVLGQVKDILNAGGSQSGRIDTSRVTRLSHLSGTVKLAAGVARNDDLDGAAAKLALGGYGQFDLLSSELDYTLRVMMAANPDESSKLLRALEGLPIPVHISGPADELRYSISLSDVAADVLRRHSDDIGAALVDEAERFFDRLFGGKKK
jgi:AsmA protein